MTEARSDAETALNQDMSTDTSTMFDDAERSSQIDQELAALKSKMGKSGSGSSSGETRNLGK